MDSRGIEIVNRTYAREIARRETWDEICSRVARGNCAKAKCDDIEQELLKQLIQDHCILPGGRHMWSVGAPGREFVSNCFVSGWSDGWIEHYAFIFLRLMEGGGVGSDYSNEAMSLPIKPKKDIRVNFSIDSDHDDAAECAHIMRQQLETGICRKSATYAIRDSREGWAKALRILLSMLSRGYSHFVGPYYRNGITFDFSHIRARGKPLHGSGGAASGPAALMQMFHDIFLLFRRYTSANKPLDSKFAILLSHYIAKAVMAGNTRRSAQIGLKSWRDSDIMDFIKLKQDEDVYTMNLSVIVDENAWQSSIIDAIAKHMAETGEPGIVNRTALDAANKPYHIFSTNPCGELPLPEFGSCCLASVNVGKSLPTMFKMASRFLVRGTLFRAQDARTQDFIDNHRVIGCGITGFADWMAMNKLSYSHGNHDVIANAFMAWRNLVVGSANEYCRELGINQPAAYTTCAPTGTMSKVAGCSEGIQPYLYDYFINRVTFRNDHPALKQLEAEGYDIEPAESLEGSSFALFPMRAGVLQHVESIETAADIGIEPQLAMQALAQEHYADNSISFTVNFDAELYSSADIANLLRRYGPKLKGTTLMPFAGAKYKQLPQERISAERYNAMVERIGQHAHGSAGECAGGVCMARPFAD